jgi:hypothetical protein
MSNKPKLHFNPLPENVMELLVDHFDEALLSGLPPENIGIACGVYGLYYFGSFAPYQGLSTHSRVPIYVGKAVTPGGRKGAGAIELLKSNHIVRRLREHSKSIESVQNLNPADFKCKWLSVEPHFVNAAESMLISYFNPLWNSVVTGFGIHTPGKGRELQARSDWDMLHPGRKLSLNLPDGNAISSISSRVEAYINKIKF